MALQRGVDGGGELGQQATQLRQRSLHRRPLRHQADARALLDEAHWTGTQFWPVWNWSNQLRAIWVSGPNDVWAVGDAGLILRCDGQGRTRVESGTTNQLTSLWGSAPNDLWAVGGGGTILRWNGATWATSASGTTSRLNAVWGTAANDVWVGYVLER